MAAGGDRPHFVIVLTDDLGCGDIDTPNIDCMAAEGVRFTNYRVAAPACTAPRGRLATFDVAGGRVSPERGGCVDGPLEWTAVAPGAHLAFGLPIPKDGVLRMSMTLSGEGRFGFELGGQPLGAPVVAAAAPALAWQGESALAARRAQARGRAPAGTGGAGQARDRARQGRSGRVVEREDFDE